MIYRILNLDMWLELKFSLLTSSVVLVSSGFNLSSILTILEVLFIEFLVPLLKLLLLPLNPELWVILKFFLCLSSILRLTSLLSLLDPN